uniref:DUF7705 domain-containing protein n=1 Tax=Salix viminalis TaxID=40686 RepID=A0A6N2MAK4_SALVM
MEKLRFCVLAFSLLEFYVTAREEYMSALGDPGMRRDSLRVAIEAWNQCNEVGEEAAGYGSPRMADCFDSGNMDTLAATCPENGKKSMPFPPESGFPCFGHGCMNMPLIYHNYTDLRGDNDSRLKGSFYGTWDLDANQMSKAAMSNSTSYFNITWEKEIGKGSWVFHNFLKTSSNYPWLMLYLRSDATEGYSGGYHYETRGMSKIVSIFSFQFNL